MNIIPSSIDYTVSGRRIVSPGFLEPPAGMTHYPPEWGLISLSAAEARSNWKWHQLRKLIDEFKLEACRNPYHPRTIWVEEAEILALPKTPPFYGR